MNLHIVPDNVFINKFYDNLRELGLTENNRIVVRTNNRKLKYLKHDFPFGRLYSREFGALTQDTNSYKKVFIHQFTPLLYRWVAKNQFQNLDWMVWGSDLYNLPFIDADLYEKLTLRFRKRFSIKELLYRAKISLLHNRYRKRAYGKVKNVLTWMNSEYEFASKHIPELSARRLFFFYENDMPYQAMDEVLAQNENTLSRRQPVYILGNSATPELNHLDAVSLMESQGVQADLLIPVSYGDRAYAHFLKEVLPPLYSGGTVKFVDEYMSFREYLLFLNNADGLIMNNIRPQGYGNIFMMMYLGKQIFLNEKNLSIPELLDADLVWQPLEALISPQRIDFMQNRSAVTKLLSHEKLLNTYSQIF